MVSNIFYFHPYLGKIPILTNIFQMGWNHQLEKHYHIRMFCHNFASHTLYLWSWRNYNYFAIGNCLVWSGLDNLPICDESFHREATMPLLCKHQPWIQQPLANILNWRRYTTVDGSKQLQKNPGTPECKNSTREGLSQFTVELSPRK